jgi:hypothetical protein
MSSPYPSLESLGATTPSGSVVPLVELLDRVERLLIRYVVFRSPAQQAAVVLWVAHTHALAAADFTPYLHVRSAEKKSGKSRLLNLLRGLVPRPWKIVEPSPPVVFRKIAKETPTILLDEVDGLFRGPKSKTPEAGALRSILNAGYERGDVVPRCVGKGEKLEDFPVFCPKAIAGIGACLPDTTADRTIPIVLVRRKASEPIAKFKQRRYAAEAKPIRQAFAAWATRAVAVLPDAVPEMPDLGNDRGEEIWEPLIAVADLAGGEWPGRAREAALALNGGEPSTESIGVLLLKAIWETLTHGNLEKILTIDLLRALVEREGEPWGGWWGKDVDQAKEGETPRKPAMELAQHLKDFDVRPKKLRIEKWTGNGYERADFEDAFSRYLPGLGRNNGTSQGTQGFAPFLPAPADFEVGTAEPVVAQGLCRRSDLASTVRTEKTNNGARPTVFDLAKAAEFPSIEIRQGMRVLAGREAWLKFLAGAIPDDVDAARRALEQGAGIP